MEKELQEFEEGPNAKLHLHSHRATLKKYQIGKHQAMMAFMDSGFKNFISIHKRLAIEMNRCLEEIDIYEWMTIEKTALI